MQRCEAAGVKKRPQPRINEMRMSRLVALLFDLVAAGALVELVLALGGGEDHAITAGGVGTEDQAGVLAADRAHFIHWGACLKDA